MQMRVRFVCKSVFCVWNKRCVIALWVARSLSLFLCLQQHRALPKTFSNISIVDGHAWSSSSALTFLFQLVWAYRCEMVMSHNISFSSFCVMLVFFPLAPGLSRRGIYPIRHTFSSSFLMKWNEMKFGNYEKSLTARTTDEQMSEQTRTIEWLNENKQRWAAFI